MTHHIFTTITTTSTQSITNPTNKRPIPNNPRIKHILHVPIALCFVSLLLLIIITTSPTAKADFDRWYTIEMRGTHAGWMHETQTSDHESNHITTEQEMHLNIKRGTQNITMRMVGRLEETTDGQPIRLYTLDALGSEPIETTYIYQDNTIITKPTASQDNDKATTAPTKPIPLPHEPFQTPSQAKSYLIQQLNNDNNQFDLTLLDPLSGPIPVHLHYTILDRNASVKLNSKIHPAVKWSITQDGQAASLQSTEWVNENAQLLRGETEFGPFTLNFILSDEQNAKQFITAPELLVSTFIKPDKPITHPRRVIRAKYQLSVTEGDLPPLPTTGAQSISYNTNNAANHTTQPADTTDEKHSSIIITINLEKYHPATTKELQNQDNYLTSSPYINSDSTIIRQLVDRAINTNKNIPNTKVGSKTIRRRAELLRSFVNRFVKNKNLSVGFASAEEVARSRNGDCTEHAVLLAAMLRADHIPARIASGLIYADSFAGKQNIFGYHMWTQALIDNQWIDLDATLRQPFDATHITLNTTALNDDSISNALSSIATLFGRLRIKIIEVAY